jgi:gamma-glutamylputrescine oxidase
VAAPTAWDVALLPIPPLEGSVRADVCVIGLGGSGLAAIRRLQKRRVTRIVGLDAGGVAAGAAGRNGGFLLAGPAHFHHRARAAWGADLARALYDETLRGIREMQRETPSCVRPTGSVRLAADAAEAEDLVAHHAALVADGFAAELRDDPRGPTLRLPDDAVFHPQERCDLLAERAWDDGAWLYGHSPVVGIEPGRVVTARGEVRCGAILVCVDGGLDRLVPELAPRVRSVRLQMLATAPVAPGLFEGAWYYRSGLDYWQQLPDGRIVLGGCRDLDADQGRASVAATSEAVQAGLDACLRDVLGVRAAVTARWAGLVGYTDDHLPIIEQVRPDLFVAGGYCGTGNVIGRLAGEAVADLARGGAEPEIARLVAAARA